MNIAILGAGNSGCALASDYAARGHEVTLIKTSHSLHDDNFAHLCAAGGRMRIHDFGKETDCVIAHLSRDVADVRAKDVVLLCTQTGYHPDVLRRVVPFLTPGQVLLMVPGYLSTAYALELASGRVFGPGRSNTDLCDYTRHPASGAYLPGFQIPFWLELTACVHRAMDRVPGMGYVGWDIAVTHDGPELIEGNWHWPGGNIIQFDGVGKYPLLRDCAGETDEEHPH